jgi:hypothetical protein
MLGLFEQWGKKDHVDSMIVLLDTGFRNGELWDLDKYQVCPDWLDPDTNTVVGLITIDENKTDLPRSVPMTARVRDIMIQRLRTQPGKLFPYDNHWFLHVWDRAKIIMGLEHDDQFVPYACRHTCASRLLQKGMRLPELQIWLGHTSPQMTMRYAHLCPSTLVRGARLLEGGSHVASNRARGGSSVGRVSNSSTGHPVGDVSRLRPEFAEDPAMGAHIRQALETGLGNAGEGYRAEMEGDVSDGGEGRDG